MRNHILTETKNIKAGQEALAYLLNRPVAHQPGLGMIYGPPGLGKTQFSRRTCIKHDFVYYSAKKADTAKSFIQSLAYLLMLRYHPNENPALTGSRSTLFNRCLDIINANSTKDHLPVIFVDEVDNIIHSPHEEIVGMLRDIVDNSAAIVMLVGMQNLRNKIVKLNAHYYNRVVYFCEFKPLSKSDVRALVRDLCEVTIDDAIMSTVITNSAGDARKVIKQIRLYEEISKKAGITHITIQDLKEMK